MKERKLLKHPLFWAIIPIFSLISIAVTASSDYKVGTWENFAQSAVTHTFDDGTKNQFLVAMPLFDKFGFKMTFATVTSGGMFPGWGALKDAFEKGHEIASHSVHHVNVNEEELVKSQQAIKENVPGEKCITIIYPYCSVPSEALVKKYYEAGRVCGSGPEGPTPGNFVKVASLIVGQGGADTELNGYANSAVDKNGWAVYLHHGVNGDHSWAHTKSSALETHLKYLDDNRDKFWVQTFDKVVRYIKERDAATLTEISDDGNRFSIKVTDNLDNEIYNYPLSIRRPLPDNWSKDDITVVQGEKEMEHSIVMDGGKSYIQFQVVPDGGDIVISNDVTAVRNGFKPTSRLDANLIRVQDNALLIYAGHFKNSKMSIRLFNLYGKELAIYNREVKAGTISRFVLNDDIRREPFIVKIYNGEKLNLVKMIVRL